MTTDSQTMSEVYRSLITLQELDREIGDAEAKVSQYAPLLEELDTPLQALEQELATVRTALERIRAEARKLERGADEKQERLKKYEDRLMKVRDAREEAAARTELDLVRRAFEADEQDAVEALEQTKRAELKIEELEKKVAAMREELEPRRKEILDERAAAEANLGVLVDRRENQTVRLDAPIRQLYEQVRGGRTKQVLAELTLDGACGHCFSMIPIQRQTEIRRGTSIVRCEGCGVILYPGEE
ncbi:MAG: zinc ribbon domain-containing protein [Longimicrobiales bacterium]